MPVLFVLIFSIIFSRRSGRIARGRTGAVRPVLLPGMIATGVVSATFASLAMTVAMEQHEGLLRRLSGTPLPRSAYFAGKVGLALVTSFLDVVLILAIGVILYGVDLPTDPIKWLAFAGVFLLGVGSCSLLGLAYTRLIRTGSSAPAIVQPPYLVLQFISGSLQYNEVPSGSRRSPDLPLEVRDDPGFPPCLPSPSGWPRTITAAAGRSNRYSSSSSPGSWRASCSPGSSSAGTANKPEAAPGRPRRSIVQALAGFRKVKVPLRRPCGAPSQGRRIAYRHRIGSRTGDTSSVPPHGPPRTRGR
ncbi:MAG: ABC transporter permease [Dehalococcoidia bacterium]|nr:ABC transporter permease [Dehalococcoidia bacterium]